MSIGIAIVLVTVVGLLGAIILVLAAKFMSVYEDPRVGEVTECLPGANCGGCGFAGCADYAKAVVEGKAPVNKCAVGGAACAAAIGKVMGVEAGSSDPVHAVVNCQGQTDVCKPKYEYQGIQSCSAAAALFGGPKACSFACLGLGDCVKACKFGAISVVDGKAKVDVSKWVITATSEFGYTGELAATSEAGVFEMSANKGEVWTLAIKGASGTVKWAVESNSSDLISLEGDKLTITGSSGSATITGTVNGGTVKAVIRPR